MKNQTNDRDAIVDRLLAGTLSARAEAATGGACLDAETLAAWTDGALDAREQARVEAHAAGCARCQQMLAAMARTLPPPSAAKWRWRMPALGWLVPLAAAATALAIWVAIPRPAPVQVSEVADSVDRLEPGSPAAPPAPAPAAANEKAETIANAQPRPEGPSERDLKKSATPRGDLRERREVAAAENQAPVAPAPPAGANALAEPVAITPAAPAAGAGAAPANAPGLARAPAAPLQSADASSNVRQAAPLAAARASGFASVAEAIVVSSNPSTRFRLLRGGSVQRSADAGATWRTEVTGATDTLTAGASPSPSVCWLIGPGGTVLLSTGGSLWRRLAFPEAADLRAIRASDAENASVTTVDGHEYVTSDGGRTWSRVQGG